MKATGLLLAGFFWLNVGRQVTTVAGRTLSGLLFFELLFLAFRTMFAALFTFPNEYKMVRLSTIRAIESVGRADLGLSTAVPH